MIEYIKFLAEAVIKGLHVDFLQKKLKEMEDSDILNIGGTISINDYNPVIKEFTFKIEVEREMEMLFARLGAFIDKKILKVR